MARAVEGRERDGDGSPVRGASAGQGAVMVAPDAVLLTLHANDELLGFERIDERPIVMAAVQGLAYLEAQKIPNEFSFVAHLRGPFSPDIREGIGRLVSFWYVREDVLAAHNAACGDAYEYHLTRDGRSFAADLAYEKNYYGEIKKMVEITAEHCELRGQELTHACMAHFLREKIPEKNPSVREVAAQGRIVGWHVGKKVIEGGMELLRALKLA